MQDEQLFSENTDCTTNFQVTQYVNARKPKPELHAMSHKALCRRASETALRAASLHAESGLACQMLLHTVACNYA